MSFSSEDRRRSVVNALEKYYEKTKPKEATKRTRKNKAPEKDIVRSICAWLKGVGADFNVIESKSTYSVKAGRYISQAVSSGFADISGNFETGVSFFIEAKAPGRRRTLRDKQLEFLRRKIDTNAFAYVCDDVERLKGAYAQFLKTKDAHIRRLFLTDELNLCTKTAKTPQNPSASLFEDESP